MRVLFLGSSQIRHIQSIFRCHGHKCDEFIPYKDNPLLKGINLIKIFLSKCVYQVGGCDILQQRVLRIALKLHKKIIVHWIGTDVLQITESYEVHQRIINNQCINLAGSPLLCAELSKIGIKAFEVPIVPCNIKFNLLPPPKKHAVLCYIPENREDFYRMDLTKEIARNFPEIVFYIVANDGKKILDAEPNMHFMGKVNSEQMIELYKECSILFRYPKHDGLSMMLLEALGVGRNVVYRYHFPYTFTPIEDNIEDILSIFHNIFSSPPKLNTEASEYINANYSMKKQINRYLELGLL